jgi:hypothetical protein
MKKEMGLWRRRVLYQDVGNGPHTDIPTTVDFDGDWNGTNNQTSKKVRF